MSAALAVRMTRSEKSPEMLWYRSKALIKPGNDIQQIEDAQEISRYASFRSLRSLHSASFEMTHIAELQREPHEARKVHKTSG